MTANCHQINDILSSRSVVDILNYGPMAKILTLLNELLFSFCILDNVLEYGEMNFK